MKTNFKLCTIDIENIFLVLVLFKSFKIAPHQQRRKLVNIRKCTVTLLRT